MDREMLLNIEIQKQNLKALPERFKAQKNVVSPVTQQMIDDYKQQFRDSYKRTDDKGTSKFYKFLIPEAEPTLDIIDKDELLKSGILEKTLEPDKIKEANDELDDLIERYDEIQNIIIPEGYENIEFIKEGINKLTAEKEEIIRKYRIRNVKKGFDLNTNKKLEEKNKKIKKKIERIKEIQYDIDERSKENVINRFKINTLKKQLEVNDEIKLKNEKVLYTIEQNNKKKLADYAKTIQIMNNGEISLEQQQGESEQDYLKRLADVALIEEDPTRAFLYNTNQFKKNLKTLIKSEWKIENLVKSFSNDDQFLLNKTFAGFKKHFNNLYGPGNKDLEVEEYVNIIRDYIDNSGATSMLKKAETRGEPSEKERLIEKYVKPFADDDDEDITIINQELLQGDFPDKETKSVVASIVDDLPEVEARAIPPPRPQPPPPIYRRNLPFTDIKLSKNDDILRIENTANNKNLYFKLTEPTGRGAANAGMVINYAIDNGSFEKIDKKINTFNNYFYDFLDKIGINDNDKEALLYRIIGNVKSSSVSNKQFINFFNSFTSGSGLTGKLGKSKKSKTTGKPTGKALQGLKKPEKPQKPKKQLVVQKGASIKEVPYRCEFGKSVILLNKLYYNNILSVKDSKGINIQGIPNSKVDDKFVNIIMKICNNEDINNKDILELTDKDAILFSVLMNKSGLKKKYNIDNTKSIKALKDRLALVEGQMLAGNTNDEIKTELYDIVFKLAQLGATSLSVARKYFKDTEKLMF